MTKDLGGDLHGRCNASTSSNHVEAGSAALLAVDEELAVGHVLELSHGSTHVDGVANLEGIEMLAHLSSSGESGVRSVSLDDELDTADVEIGRDGSISSHHGLSINDGR